MLIVTLIVWVDFWYDIGQRIFKAPLHKTKTSTTREQETSTSQRWDALRPIGALPCGRPIKFEGVHLFFGKEASA